MNRPYRRESHFEALDFGDTSVFSSKFPVDLRDKEVKKTVVTLLPSYLDTIFLLHPSSEDFSTQPPKGSIPLYPALTNTAVKKLSGDALRKANDRHSTLQALTDGAPLSALDVRLTRENRAVRDFSVAAASASVGERAWYELRGVLNTPGDENVFEIAKFTDRGEEASLVADDDLAQTYLRALHEQLSGTAPVEDMPIDLSLMQLLDASPQLYHQQFTHEDDRPQAHVGVQFAAERHNVISQGITRLIGYRAIIKQDEVLSDIGVEMNGSFSLTYSKANRPRYTAEMNFLVRALSDTPSHDDRAAYFEQLSLYYRQNPERVFKGLADAAKRLTALS